AREGWCMREPFLRIGSAAVFALGFALAGLSVANAESVMKECGADWQAAKAAGTTNGQTWQEFLAKDIPAYPYCSAALCMVQSMNRRGFGGGGAMARNLVQFQKGLSEQEFDRLYGTEELCRAVVIGARWPDGFECPACGGRKHSVIKSRGLFQCSACRRQTSPTAGTIFASTKLTLRQWFRAMYHMTQSKKGISSIELGRRLGVKQDTAWKVKH